MPDRHSDDAMRELEPIDRERLVSIWSDSEAKQALFQEITTMPVDAPAPDRPRDRQLAKRRAVTVLAAAVLAALTGTIAIASGGFTSENTPGVPVREMSEFTSVVEPYRTEFVFAPHRSFDGAVAAIDETADDHEAQMAEDAMADMVGMAAVCSWLDHWRTATLNGNEAAARTAIDSVKAAQTWPWALVNTEFFSQNLSSHIAAMRAEDVTYVTWDLGLNCLPAMTEVPSIPPTGPVPDGIEEPTQFYRNASASN